MAPAKTALFVLLAVVTVAFSAFWFRQARAKWTGWPNWIQFAIGAVTDFFDTLGVGSFATTASLYTRVSPGGGALATPPSLYKLSHRVDDRDIPGTLNVGHTIPTFAEAFLFIFVADIEVE